MKYLTYIAVALLAFGLGYWQGCSANECKRQHVVAASSTTKFTQTEKPDSASTLAIATGKGIATAKATTTADGKKRFNRTLPTENGGAITLDDTYDPATDEISGVISYVIIKPVVVYFKSYLQQMEFATRETVEVEKPDTDDFHWFGLGGLVGVLATIIAVLL